MRGGKEVKGFMEERNGLRVTDVRFCTASAADVAKGLLGWIAFELNDELRVDGCALRRTLEGALIVSFPGRRDRKGSLHYFVRPLNDRVRRDLQRQIVEALGIEDVQRR